MANDAFDVVSSSVRAGEMASAMLRRIDRRTDRLFAGLLLVEWLAGIGLALWVAPRAWTGPISQTHAHLWAAVVLGAAIIVLPVWLALTRAGSVPTRHIIAAGQMLMSALLIHLTGGRIEAHFLIFVSLALLSFYRDWRVLVTASAVAIADHFLRGMLWPQSIYGTAIGARWRWLEHAGWVVCLDLFLAWSGCRSCRAIDQIANRQVALEANDWRFEEKMVARTDGLNHFIETIPAGATAERTQPTF